MADVLTSPYASANYHEALFDNVYDILGVEAAGLVAIAASGVSVNCPIASEKATDAPGNTPVI